MTDTDTGGSPRRASLPLHFTPPAQSTAEAAHVLRGPSARSGRGTLTSMTEPISGTFDDVTRKALSHARAGDHRARPAEINGHRAILTPHMDTDGNLDADDLAAQVYALAHGMSSDDGQYTGGYFTAEGIGHYSPAPADLDEPTSQ